MRSDVLAKKRAESGVGTQTNPTHTATQTESSRANTHTYNSYTDARANMCTGRHYSVESVCTVIEEFTSSAHIHNGYDVIVKWKFLCIHRHSARTLARAHTRTHGTHNEALSDGRAYEHTSTRRIGETNCIMDSTRVLDAFVLCTTQYT